MASMERSAAPRGVKKKSAGRSDYMNVCSVKKTGKKRRRNAPLIRARIDLVRNPTQSFVRVLQLKSAGDKYDGRAAPFIYTPSVITQNMLLYCAGTRDNI